VTAGGPERRLAVTVLTSALPGAEAGADMVHVRRWRELGRRAAVVVVVPTPWAPRALRRHARWGAYADLPRAGRLEGLDVHYPRYLQLPLAAFAPWAGASMALGARGLVRRLRDAGACDVLFAQSILPDGLAAVLLGRWTGVPATCLGRGSDVNVLCRRSAAGRRVAAWTLRHAAGVGAVAHDLAATLGGLAAGAAPCVIYNGIDLERFAPGDRAAARRALGIAGEHAMVLYVGRVTGGKGLGHLLEAFARVARARPAARLVLLGEGPLRAPLARQAAALGIARQVDFVGEVPYDRVPLWMRAADVVALASEHEGFPNVVREALACGRPVVATAVGDVPRIVTPDAGRVVGVGEPAAFADALAAVLDRAWDPAALRAKVGHMTWQANAEATYRFLAAATATARAA
jgi:glycosyltransferase involved in cell wall biosynthesis